MAKKVFLSYCHKQGEWVRERLLPVLKAAGCEVFIDVERFKGGYGLTSQMDAWQDSADVSLLVMSPECLASKNCQHEIRRAIAHDPDFSRCRVLPVVRVSCDMSVFTSTPNPPLWVDLADDCDAGKWDLLLKSLDATGLGTAAPSWLEARDEIVRKARDQGQSVNLLVHGSLNWRAILHEVRNEYIQDLGVVDLDDPATVTREGLVRQILAACGGKTRVPAPPHDLEALNGLLMRPTTVRLALLHFETVLDRPQYGPDLFHTMRYLLNSGKLVLLIESRVPFRDLIPVDHPLSNFHPHPVELREG